MTNEYIKPPVEIRYKNELDALKSVDIGKSLRIDAVAKGSANIYIRRNHQNCRWQNADKA